VTCTNTITLGAYLLGALDPHERFEFEAHIGDCDTCRTELVRLAPLPGMLNQISLDDFAEGLPPTTLEEGHPTAPVPGLPLSAQLLRPETMPELHPDAFRAEAFPDESIPPELGGPVPQPGPHSGQRPTILPGQVPIQRGLPPAGEIRPPLSAAGDQPDKPEPRVLTSRRRRYRMLAGAAALVVVLAAGVVLGWRAFTPEPAPPPEVPGVTWSGAAPGDGPVADARLVDHEWGTEIQVKLHGLPSGRQCYLMVYDADGYKEIAGWWGTDHEYAEEIPASTSIPRSKIDKLELLLDDRSVVLTIPAQGR
jgi:Putative zinc-finger